jgi:hypothetical protein
MLLFSVTCGGGAARLKEIPMADSTSAEVGVLRPIESLRRLAG